MEGGSKDQVVAGKGVLGQGLVVICRACQPRREHNVAHELKKMSTQIIKAGRFPEKRWAKCSSCFSVRMGIVTNGCAHGHPSANQGSPREMEPEHLADPVREPQSPRYRLTGRKMEKYEKGGKQLMKFKKQININKDK